MSSQYVCSVNSCFYVLHEWAMTILSCVTKHVLNHGLQAWSYSLDGLLFQTQDNNLLSELLWILAGTVLSSTVIKQGPKFALISLWSFSCQCMHEGTFCLFLFNVHITVQILLLNVLSVRHTEWYFIYTSSGRGVEIFIIPVFNSVEKGMSCFSVSTIFFFCDL